MKNPLAKLTFQFILVFLIAGIFFVAVGDDETPPMWNRSLGDYIVNVLMFVALGMIIFALPIIIRFWRAEAKNKK